ncbi:hypothetical protein [Yunchengibacter salinarum]|uniref:hypothetical protein n=1 Tax=Yunchengibacter salinarum TaxID=3133399 RepID=UPI0035B5C19E
MSEFSGPPPSEGHTRAVREPLETVRTRRDHQQNPPPERDGGSHARQESDPGQSGSRPHPHRDPAVSIAAATAHLDRGDSMAVTVVRLDSENRPIVDSAAMRLAVEGGPELAPGDRVEMIITEAGHALAGRLTAHNSRPLDPAPRVDLTVISLHAGAPPPEGVEPLPGQSPHDQPAHGPVAAHPTLTYTRRALPRGADQLPPTGSRDSARADQPAASMDTQQARLRAAHTAYSHFAAIAAPGGERTDGTPPGETARPLPAAPLTLPAFTETGYARALHLLPADAAASTPPDTDTQVIRTVETARPAEVAALAETPDHTAPPPMLKLTTDRQRLFMPAETVTPLVGQQVRITETDPQAAAEALVRRMTEDPGPTGLATPSAPAAGKATPPALTLADATLRPTRSPMPPAEPDPVRADYWPPDSPPPQSSVTVTDVRIRPAEGAAPAQAAERSAQRADIPTHSTGRPASAAPPPGSAMPGLIGPVPVVLTLADGRSLMASVPAAAMPEAGGHVEITAPRDSFPTTGSLPVGRLAEQWPAFREAVATLGGLDAPASASGAAGGPAGGAPGDAHAGSTEAGVPPAAPQSALPQNTSAPLFASSGGTDPATMAASTGGIPAVAADLAARSASGGGRLANSLLFFMAALRGGSVDQWIGEQARQALQQSAPRLLERLRGDVGRLMRLAGRVESRRDGETRGDWRGFFLPLDAGQSGAPLLAVLSPDGGEDDHHDGEDPCMAGEKRFLIETRFTAFGPTQLDGRWGRNQLSLILRASAALPDDLKTRLPGLLADTASAGGFSARLTIEDNAPLSLVSDRLLQSTPA